MSNSQDAPTILQVDAVASGAVVAPSLSFGKQGNVTNAFLLANNVPSDSVGIPLRTINTELTYIATANDGANTYDVEIYEHDGTTFTLLFSFTNTATRSSEYVPPSPISATTGKELACKITNGSAKDPVVILFATGDIP